MCAHKLLYKPAQVFIEIYLHSSVIHESIVMLHLSNVKNKKEKKVYDDPRAVQCAKYSSHRSISKHYHMNNHVLHFQKGCDVRSYCNTFIFC